MLSLTRKADYALVALVFLGDCRRQGKGPVSAPTVAATFDMPRPVLTNTLKALARHGLIHSHRGVGGGYELAMDPAEVSLLEAVRAVEGDPTEDEPAEHDPAAGEPNTHEVVQRLRDQLHELLAGLTVADLLEEPAAGTALPAGSAESFVPLRTGVGSTPGQNR